MNFKLDHSLFAPVKEEFQKMIGWTKHHSVYETVKVKPIVMLEIMELACNAMDDIKTLRERNKKLVSALEEIEIEIEQWRDSGNAISCVKQIINRLFESIERSESSDSNE